jgi:hypothetical protein
MKETLWSEILHFLGRLRGVLGEVGPADRIVAAVLSEAIFGGNMRELQSRGDDDVMLA